MVLYFMFYERGYVLPIGKKGWVMLPSNFTITGWNMTITPDVSTVTCDLYVASYDYYPPNSTMILNTKYRPFVFKGDQRRDTNVTTSKWRFHTLSQDMYLKCVVISVDGAKAMNLTIYGTR